nr:epiphycan [Salvelinus alpinus]
MRMLARLILGLFVLKAVVANPRFARQVELDTYDSANYDVDLDNLNLENRDVYDFEDGLTIDEPQVRYWGEIGGMMCTCLGGSVYCDDVKLTSVPPLPKETTHFYARYNHITKINKGDFAQMNKLKRIDLTANEIASIADDAFSGLPVLEELVLRENGVSQLPALPPVMTLIDASHNNIGATGIHKEAFKDMTGLLYLYLTDNHIDHIPVPLPDSLRSLHLQRNNIQMIHEDTFCNLKDFNYIRNALEDIRLDGNPINLSRTPQAYVCLPRVPIGAHI